MIYTNYVAENDPELLSLGNEIGTVLFFSPANFCSGTGSALKWSEERCKTATPDAQQGINGSQPNDISGHQVGVYFHSSEILKQFHHKI